MQVLPPSRGRSPRGVNPGLGARALAKCAAGSVRQAVRGRHGGRGAGVWCVAVSCAHWTVAGKPSGCSSAPWFRPPCRPRAGELGSWRLTTVAHERCSGCAPRSRRSRAGWRRRDPLAAQPGPPSPARRGQFRPPSCVLLPSLTESCVVASGQRTLASVASSGAQRDHSTSSCAGSECRRGGGRCRPGPVPGAAPGGPCLCFQGQHSAWTLVPPWVP